MSLFEDINLWLADHGIDTNPDETRAYYDFVNDDYLLSEFLDSVYEEIAARWDGLTFYPFSPYNSLEVDQDGNVYFIMPVFKRFFEYDKFAKEHRFYWKFASNQVKRYYANGSQYYALPINNVVGRTDDEEDLPNLGPVLVVRRFVLPVLVDDMREAGILCHVYDDEDEVSVIFDWNCYKQRCPFNVSGAQRLTIDDIVDICQHGWGISAQEVTVFDGGQLVMDWFAPGTVQGIPDTYYIYREGKQCEVWRDMMLSVYSGREVAEMYRAEDNPDNVVMLLN